MITKTGIHVDLDSTFTNPLVYEENGQVNHVVADNLTPETRYYTRAYVVSDGTTVYSGNTRSFTTQAQEQEYFGFTNRSSSNSATLMLHKTSGSVPTIQLQYSLDNGSTWSDIYWVDDELSNLITLPANGRVIFKGNNNSFSSNTITYYFIGGNNDTFDVSGNIMSLLDSTMSRTDLSGCDYCFRWLFRLMTGLIDASGLLLPAMTLAPHVYEYLFYGCSALISAPAILPATTLTPYCYNGLCYECRSLVDAPILPATNLANYCYQEAFYRCEYLVDAPALPATTLAEGCYLSTFSSCVRLVNAPALPATTLAARCYESIFHGCIYLVNAPALPATTLAQSCYASAFWGCSRLVNAPVLPATTLVTSCYNSMFWQCTSLSRIEVYFTDSSVSNALGYWVYEVSSQGDFFNMGNADIPIDSVDGIPSGWTQHINYLCFTANQANSTVGLSSGTPNIEISTDGSTWSTWDLSTITLSNIGDKVYMRGTNNTLNGTKFALTGSIAGSGDLMTLLGYSPIAKNIPGECFYETFANQTALTSAPYLSATSKTSNLNCAYTFKNCTGLTSIPKFPYIPTTVQNYSQTFEGMYMGCTGLTGTLDLSYMKEAYDFNCEDDSIFRGTNYTRLDLTGITDLTSKSYTFKRAFNNMPELISVDMRNCTNISGSYTLEDIFKYNSKLNEIIMGVTAYDTLNQTYYNWVDGVSATGIFYNLGNANFPTGVNGIPYGWGVKTHYGVDYFYIENRYNGANTVTITKNGNPSTGSDLAYSFDKETWTTVTYTNNLCSIALSEQNQKLYFRSSTGLNESATDYYKFSATQNHVVGGDVRTLIDYDDDTIDSIPAYGFIKLFENDVNLSDASDLSFIDITTVGVSSLNSMFYGCTSLVNAPTLYATTLAASCYDSMHYRCTSLVSAPALPATTLAPACYRRIFASCSSLVNAPVLPATTLAEGCYYEAFADCVSLVNAPALPATTLAEDCYNGLFKNCSSLVKTPKLFATALALNSYDSFFYGCSLIDEVTVYIQTWNANNADNWLYGCASSGVVYNMNDAAIPTNTYSGVPVNWTAETPHYTELAYIHKDTLENQMDSQAKVLDKIDTLIAPEGKNYSFRLKGKYKGYKCGSVLTGVMVHNDVSTADNYRFRVFSYGGRKYFDCGNQRSNAISFSYDEDVDITITNCQWYDNINQLVIYSSTLKTLPALSTDYTFLADCSTWWLKSLEIFDEYGITVFNGVAAEYNGDYGLWDSITGQLFTNSTITIVGEQ